MHLSFRAVSGTVKAEAAVKLLMQFDLCVSLVVKAVELLIMLRS